MANKKLKIDFVRSTNRSQLEKPSVQPCRQRFSRCTNNCPRDVQLPIRWTISICVCQFSILKRQTSFRLDDYSVARSLSSANRHLILCTAPTPLHRNLTALRRNRMVQFWVTLKIYEVYKGQEGYERGN